MAIKCGERLYEVTAEDRLWLLRAVAREGAVREQVAQTLINGFAFHHAHRHMPTLTKWIRAYAQPVNPRWFPDGDLHLKWEALGKDSKLAAKLRIKHSSATSFTGPVIAAVDRALTLGPVDIDPRCTDYAAAWIDASKRMTALTPPVKGVNRLWMRHATKTMPSAATWTGYEII
jgi:hypothetical protein